MSDFTGATAVPLVAPLSGVSVTDPLLSYCLSYFQAVANTHGVAAWQAVQPNSLPVKTVWSHDPEEMGLSELHLPALFMFRSSQTKRVDVASEIEVFYSKVSLIWVPNEQAVERRTKRSTYANGLFKLLDIYLERSRDPAWYVPGDNYPPGNPPNLSADQLRTRMYGSVLPHFAGYRRLWLDRWRPYRLKIEMAPGVRPRFFEAYEATFELEEQTHYDIDRFPNDPNNGLDQKIITIADEDNPADIAAEQITP